MHIYRTSGHHDGCISSGEIKVYAEIEDLPPMGCGDSSCKYSDINEQLEKINNDARCTGQQARGGWRMILECGKAKGDYI